VEEESFIMKEWSLASLAVEDTVGRGTYGFAYERIAPRDVQRKIKETPVDRTGKVTEATLSEKVKQLKTELEIANDQIKQL
jgi:hypothetical protein